MQRQNTPFLCDPHLSVIFFSPFFSLSLPLCCWLTLSALMNCWRSIQGSPRSALIMVSSSYSALSLEASSLWSSAACCYFRRASLLRPSQSCSWAWTCGVGMDCGLFLIIRLYLYTSYVVMWMWNMWNTVNYELRLMCPIDYIRNLDNTWL